ncbi:DUF1206 domain-containing protein [Kriegella aquimaris]|uniref:DUF1206 domain-containing protein n=1 Tax=Kriegella aquimaris TaxID=192904 RepID=A0A1G9REK9_9FLAO|nr:DUF1206 domain-containing protein [Kriegella aquimaris]SDM21664.1 protein of unknown function [Kriegella aquimaris]
MKKSLKNTANIGFISKGFIYLVIGLLTLLAALNMGGESSGTNQALKFLKRQPFGQVLLMVLGIGLLCYSFWMFVRCFKDPENIGNDRKGKMMRFGILITGLVYTFLAFLCFYHLFTYSPEGSSGSRYINLLGPSLVSILFIGIGVILVIQTIILMVGIIKGGLLDQFNLEGRKGSYIMRLVGKFGFFSRAFIVGIIAYFFLRAGLYSGSHEIKGVQDAFSFLDQSNFGTVLMVFTSVGFISYGLFFIFLSRYRTFED